MAEIGDTLGGRYRLIELLGQGGMATIYRAVDTQLGRVLSGVHGVDCLPLKGSFPVKAWKSITPALYQSLAGETGSCAPCSGDK